MASRTITSADSTFVISSSEFALAAVALEGYAADAAFAMENVDTAETLLGVDGKLSAGWVPRSYPQTVTFQADSTSVDILELIVATQDAQRTVYRLNGVITLPGNNRTFIMSRGVLRSYSAMPNAQRVLQPLTYTFEWERVIPVPLG